MPTLPDLELSDFDLKPYMDPNILLDTFSPEDMDIWQSYNLFVDDNINSSIKDQIKEENTDMMDGCFTSICPNDLINNNNNGLVLNQSSNDIVYQQSIYTTQPTQNVLYNQQSSTEYYSHNSSSSCSSSPSIVCSDSIQYFENKSIQSSLDSLNFVPGQHLQLQQLQQIQNQLIGENSNFHHVYNGVGELASANSETGDKMEYFQIHSSSENETSLSPSSSMSSASSVNGDLSQFQQQQFQKTSKNIQKLDQHLPIIIVEASNYQQQQKNQYKNVPITVIATSQQNQQTQAKLSKKSSNCLPPSPPSSFGSDSESNQSTSTAATKTMIKSTKSSLKTKFKSNKLNNQLRSNATSTIIKQLRNQPYSLKSTKATKIQKAVTIKTESGLDTSNSFLNVSTNSDDDCWPFLCSISKLPSSGPIMLTEEEKRTLVQEGHQVPTQLPLSKSEEKVLKKIRRKIKNKISAQESRRKKKEYVDSLEKRMESYINENVQLRKRLESLEVTNKNLMYQLKSSSSNTEGMNVSDSTTNPSNNISSANQFGTLLLVLVLFFTVLFGVWSPLISKDQLGQASASAVNAAAASISVRSGVRNSMSYSSTAAVAVASIAVASSIAGIKSESLSPGGGDEVDNNDKNLMVHGFGVDEEEFLANDAILTGQVNNNNVVALNKSGMAVELTKVRPFVRKMPDYPVLQQASEESNQKQQQNIIILNLANTPQSPLKTDAVSSIAVTSSTTVPVNNNIFSVCQQQKPLNIQPPNSVISMSTNSNSYRVITNTTQIANGSCVAKLPTRFRLVNNGINAINTHTLTPSVIKMNTLA